MKLPKCKYDKEYNTEMDLALVNKSPTVSIECHGILTIKVSFDYGGTSQGCGYCINDEFLKKFIMAFGKSNLDMCMGSIFVEHNNGEIFRLIPIGDGEEFDIKEWSNDCRMVNEI